jgi:hypothetical protein
MVPWDLLSANSVRTAGRVGACLCRAITDRQMGGLRAIRRKSKAKINPTTNSIQAIWLAVPAIPLKPNTPAIIAITRNMRAHPNMSILRSADPNWWVLMGPRQIAAENDALEQLAAAFPARLQWGRGKLPRKMA